MAHPTPPPGQEAGKDDRTSSPVSCGRAIGPGCGLARRTAHGALLVWALVVPIRGNASAAGTTHWIVKS